VALPSLAGQTFALHPVHAAPAAADLRPHAAARWDAASGTLTVPAPTAVVLLRPERAGPFAVGAKALQPGWRRPAQICQAGVTTRLFAFVTQTQYTSPMKSAVIPQIRVEPELRAELESVLRQGETLTDFVEATVRNAIAFRRVQTSFHARAQAASLEYHRTGVSVPVETVLERLQSKLDAKRKKLGR